MRHRAKGRQLSRTASHKKALLANLANSLLRDDEGDPGSPFSLGRLRDAVRLETARAHPQPPGGAVYDGPHPLQVRVPAPVRLIVRVANVVPHHGALATDVAHSSHGIRPTDE